MGGPKVSRLPNSMTAPQPSLTGPSLDLLQSIFGGGPNSTGQGTIGSRTLGAFGQSGLQQQTGNTYSQMLSGAGNPLGGQGGGGAAGTPGGGAAGLFSAAGGALQNQFLGQNPGQNVLSAYEPLFQRNLQQIQGSGPRFSSGNDQLRARALQDFNAFAGQTLMQGQQQQLQAALGGGQLGLGAVGQAGGFANAQQAQQQAVIQQMLAALFGGGGIGTPAAINVQPGLGQQLAGLAGTGLGFALGGGAGAGIGSQLGSAIGGGGGGFMQPVTDMQGPGGTQSMFDNYNIAQLLGLGQ